MVADRLPAAPSRAPKNAMLPSMSRQIIATDAAPKAIGPYCQAVVATGARTLYCSGQIPIDPATGEIVGAGDIKIEAERVMLNLEAVLAAANATFANVVRTTIYLVDLKHFAVVNEIYGRHFTGAPPARATVQVAALPKGCQVEIDAIAILD